ncbi:unnamed protein product [Nezara viridula]|uniref:Uncharacterized protein n=1 Tax=Nezara viridula TaxID=85310 RepID=A0A9P0HEI2_NEZVI|nr:unnamed protein product [Nezara viridula]
MGSSHPAGDPWKGGSEIIRSNLIDIHLLAPASGNEVPRSGGFQWRNSSLQAVVSLFTFSSYGRRLLLSELTPRVTGLDKSLRYWAISQKTAGVEEEQVWPVRSARVLQFTFQAGFELRRGWILCLQLAINQPSRSSMRSMKNPLHT